MTFKILVLRFMALILRVHIVGGFAKTDGFLLVRDIEREIAAQHKVRQKAKRWW